MLERKMLVSDYDGTYNLHNDKTNNIQKNNLFVSSFIDSNNIFMFATGRTYNSIYDEFVKYNLRANYISCANGNVLFDSKFNLINYNRISYQNLLILKDYYDLFEFIEKKNPYGETADNEIVEYCLIYNSYLSKNKFLEFLLKKGNFSYYHEPTNPLMIHIFEKDNNKFESIQFVSQKENVNPKNIFTIGDGYNDIAMIKNYNGFSMNNSPQDVKDESLGNYSSVSTLIKDIQKSRVKMR